MRRGAFSGTAILAAFVAVSAWAQQSPSLEAPLKVAAESGSLAAIPPALIGEALTVTINASVGSSSETPDWEATDIKYTIPGTSVSVKMVGSEVAIVITVTPYKKKEGGLLLVAQGQVWYKDGESGLRYRTTIDTLSVAFGERVLFYPFGAHAGIGAPLRVELIMDRYSPDAAKDKAKP
ncbi:MAG: hypothetical protein CVV47_14165 [Spirochaetae bacterium HGW-Spirochaetae-3]|nr:MAG: hypothetical protein CVV47_14165 [Spirochaetae bacterium HGW-Spirochaetae-3]